MGPCVALKQVDSYLYTLSASIVMPYTGNKGEPKRAGASLVYTHSQLASVLGFEREGYDTCIYVPLYF